MLQIFPIFANFLTHEKNGYTVSLINAQIIHTVTVTNKLHNICNLTTFKSIFVFACSYNYREYAHVIEVRVTLIPEEHKINIIWKFKNLKDTLKMIFSSSLHFIF